MTNLNEGTMSKILLGWCETCSKSLYEGEAFSLSSFDAPTMDKIEGDIYCLECHKKYSKNLNNELDIEVEELNFEEN